MTQESLNSIGNMTDVADMTVMDLSLPHQSWQLGASARQETGPEPIRN